jgi:MFS family permease
MAVTGLIAIPLTSTLPGIMLAIIVTNLGCALFVPPIVAWVGDLFPATQRSRANAAFSLISGVAAIGVLVVSGVLFERVGRAAPFVLVALGTLLLAGLGVLWVHEPPPAMLSGQAPTRVWYTLRRMVTSRPRPWRWLLVALFLSAGATSMVETGSSSFAVFTLGMP